MRWRTARKSSSMTCCLHNDIQDEHAHLSPTGPQRVRSESLPTRVLTKGEQRYNTMHLHDGAQNPPPCFASIILDFLPLHLMTILRSCAFSQYLSLKCPVSGGGDPHICSSSRTVTGEERQKLLFGDLGIVYLMSRSVRPVGGKSNTRHAKP
jgi:hypothetical protein